MQSSQKLNEARYFLEQMKSNIPDRNALEFNLSAFLSSARSVTLYLQKEYSGNRGFEIWYKKKQEEMKKDELMNFFNSKRTLSIHQEPVLPRMRATLEIADVVRVTDSANFTVRRSDGTEESILKNVHKEWSEAKPQTETQPERIDYEWFFRDRPTEDLFSMCEEYLNKLMGILDEAERITNTA